ncbi:hypothetical protein GCM10023322_26060 [Rugosimonospora acidiphila]|uniref:Immunity protein Imm1 n=1 Tax=Rugosimonospora acidiphila TaxID=556531 RepID=A0ABP9RR93_9ACTN
MEVVWHDVTVADWVEFRRSEAYAVVAAVRAVAEAADPGEYGDGVEVVVEAPPPGWLRGIFGDHEPDQARIVVTRPDGESRYPFSVQLVTDHGEEAARRLPATSGWTRSSCAGLAFLMQKGGPDDPPDWPGLVHGALHALAALRPDAGDEGWRVRTDRAIRRE